jgi:NTP pyrophosphatase (non-canonical NTP hydrolase)
MHVPKIKDDSTTTITELSNMVWQYLEERDWHTASARSTATSIVLEASELLEHYQWSDKPVGNKEELAEELADILNYCLEFARKHDIDITTAITAKLTKSAKKYPAEKFKNKDAESNRIAWIEAKTAHKKTSL